jgi:hypothetical protein
VEVGWMLIPGLSEGTLGEGEEGRYGEGWVKGYGCFAVRSVTRCLPIITCPYA